MNAILDLLRALPIVLIVSAGMGLILWTMEWCQSEIKSVVLWVFILFLTLWGCLEYAFRVIWPGS